jgi:replication factor C subunit 3/5
MMSDYEDDMDVDVPDIHDRVVFSSDNTNSKGKRSAANLPVEAEDSLPWFVPPIELLRSLH